MRALPAAILLAALAAASACSRADRGKAVQWLWSQQGSDGGWHSTTYGLLRSGQSLTPFVLLTLLEVEPGTSRRVDSALGFIRSHIAADGSLGRMDAWSQDYPNYATALAVRAIVKAKRPGWQNEVAPLVQYLRGQQFAVKNGWSKSDAAFGAWGMGGERLRPPATGHVDLSMTRHVLEALRDAGVPAADPVFTDAQVYLGRLQNPDGGFYFSTTEEDTNKAGGHRSYGTATVDGILALLASNVSADDNRISRAMAWLLPAHKRDRIAGFQGEAYQRWHQGLAFYFAAGLADLPQSLGPRLRYDLPSQRSDGSFENPENLVKEDDPLIATVFAVRSLGLAAR